MPMSNFIIRFSFRGKSHIASVYPSKQTASSYSVYFTDVELVLEFGSKVEYTKNGSLKISKDHEKKSVLLLQEALSIPLEQAA